MGYITLLEFLQVTVWHSTVTLEVFKRGTEVFDDPLFVATCKNDCSPCSDDFFMDFSEYFKAKVLVFRSETPNHVDVVVLV